MASKPRRYRHRSRPAPGEVRAVLDGYAALAGGASADTTGANADKCGQAMSAFAGASGREAMNDSNTPAHDDDVDRARRALAWWSDPALYGPGGWTARAEVARAACRQRLAPKERKRRDTP